MLVLKSFAAGLAATLITGIGAVFVVLAVLAVKSRDLPEGQAYSWDPISLGRHSVVTWAILIGGFALGFVWQHRRAR